MQYLKKCSCDCSNEFFKAEVSREAMQVLQPSNFFKDFDFFLFFFILTFQKTLHTLNTLPGWSTFVL